MASKITSEPYDLVKIEKLKHFLESCQQNGKPKFYEIFVDNLKVVDKTNDPTVFDDYLIYVGDDTRMMKVLIYTSTENCPRNDKFLFTFKDPSQEKQLKDAQELNGIEVQHRIETALQSERERMQTEQLKQSLEQTKQTLLEAEDYIGQLEDQLEANNNKKNSWKEVQLGNVASIAIEAIVKRNPQLVEKIPLLGSLSGILGDDASLATASTNTPANEQPEGTASFSKKKDDNNPNISSEDLEFLKLLKTSFSQAQVTHVFEIILGLANHPEQIPIIHELIHSKN